MRISVVTPSFNQRDFLARTAHSVLSQAPTAGGAGADGAGGAAIAFDLRWIIVDGGSTDGTVDLLRSLSAADPRVRFTSEPDHGQAHAINKGLSAADGDVVAWLNADDLYAPGALSAVASAFAANPAAQWLAGRCRIIDADDRPIRPRIARYKDGQLARYSWRRLLRENFIAQPAVFWRRPFGQSVGPLDESLYWTMDYDLWLRMGRLAEPLLLPRVLAFFRLHPSSKSGRVNRRQFDEGYEVACRYAGPDRTSLLLHRLNVEKIVLAYRLMRLLGR